MITTKIGSEPCHRDATLSLHTKLHYHGSYLKICDLLALGFRRSRRLCLHEYFKMMTTPVEVGDEKKCQVTCCYRDTVGGNAGCYTFELR